MSVELGIREVQMITDAIKSVINDAIYFGNPESFKMLDGSYMKNAEDWRTSIISNLTQGTPGNTYASHSGVLFNHTNKIDDNMGKIRLETLIDYALENFKAFEETENLGNLTAPEFLWTGFEETSEAIYDIAMELSSDFGLEIPSVSDDGSDIKTLLTETSEALMDSDIKVEDLSNSLELKIRVLDDIQANELYQMYATFPSTEGVRPFMIQLIELYDQVDMLDTEDVFTINETLEDLYINRDPGTFLKEYNPVGKGRPTLEQVVKNKIQYYFQEMTDLQERYITFNNSPSTIFQPVHNSDIERMFSNIGSIEEPMRDAFGDMIFSSKEPAQFSSTFKVFEGSDTNLPFQINKTYMDRFQEIAGRKAYDVTLDPNYAVDLNKTKGMTAGEFLNDYVSKNIYDQRIDDDMREKLDRININDAKTDLPYDPRYVTPEKLVQDINKATPTNVVDDFYVVPPDKLQEAVNLVKNDPRYALDINAMHKDYLQALENAIVETGFIGDTDTRGGLYADLDVVLEDWLSEGGDLEGNKFFNNSPTWDNLPDTQNVRGLIASAGGPENIKEGYVIPQYFKDKPNVPYADTPTNVVDDINKLNQELNTKYADVIDNDYGLNFELRDGRLHITDMYLKDTERGKGIGSQIFDEIKQFADNNNLEISLYNDGDFNTTFWENKGFRLWSDVNNVEWIDTPDDYLNLQILDTDTPTNVVDDVKTLDIENYKPITIEVLDDAGLHARPAEKLVASLNKQNIPLVILEDGNLKEVGMIGLLRQQKLKGETLDIYIPTDAEFNLDNVEGIKLAPTPTNVVDDLDDVISKTDGVENLNKAKQIMNKNPGVFRKIFSVLEKLDIGDQVITKAVLPTLGRMGVAGATGPLALAYAGYETALLLGDISNAIYQARTTDEGFWDNFGEVSDKYSIAYKISKPVYDIILGNLSTVLEQEDEEFIPQYSYGR